MSSPWWWMYKSGILAIGARPADWLIEEFNLDMDASTSSTTPMHLDMDAEPTAGQKETKANIIGGQGWKIGGPTPI